MVLDSEVAAEFALSIQHNSWNQSPPESFNKGEFVYGLVGLDCEDIIDIALMRDFLRQVHKTSREPRTAKAILGLC